jgi:hypothetical protein
MFTITAADGCGSIFVFDIDEYSDRHAAAMISFYAEGRRLARLSCLAANPPSYGKETYAQTARRKEHRCAGRQRL